MTDEKRKHFKSGGYSRAFTHAPQGHKRYLLDKIPAGLWTEFKAKCKREGVSVRAQILKLAKEKSVACSWHPDMGKGSHGVLKYGDKRTTVRNLKDELKTGTYHGMLKQYPFLRIYKIAA